MRKKSKYKPKPKNPNAMFMAILGVQRVGGTGDDAVRLKAVNYAALDEIKMGRGTRAHMDVVINVLNMADVLARWGHGQDWLPEIEDAQRAVVALAQRSVTIGRYTFKAEELKAISLAFEIHDAQIEEVTVAEFDRAIRHVHQAIITKQVTTLPSIKGPTT